MNHKEHEDRRNATPRGEDSNGNRIDHQVPRDHEAERGEALTHTEEREMIDRDRQDSRGSDEQRTQSLAEANRLSNTVIGLAIEVHRELGPGLLESAYRQCLTHELAEHGVRFAVEKQIPVRYKKAEIDCAFRADIIVEDSLILELKAVDRILPIHEAQVITYLRLTGLRLGLIINFNTKLLKNGIKRIVL